MPWKAVWERHFAETCGLFHEEYITFFFKLKPMFCVFLYSHFLLDTLNISLHILNQYGLVGVKLKLQPTACELCNTAGYNLANVAGVMSYISLFKENFWIQPCFLYLPAPCHQSMEETSELCILNLSYTASVGHTAFFWVPWGLTGSSGYVAIFCLPSWSKNASFVDKSRIIY